MTVAQILAVSIFVVMFVLMVLDKIEKQYITLVAGALTLILVFGVAMHSMDAVIETLNVKNIFTKGFWITSGEGSEESSGINEYIPCRYDGNGRRYGKGRILPVVMLTPCEAGAL